MVINDRIERRTMFSIKHHDWLQPMIDQCGAIVAQRALYAPATIVATDNDVLYLKNLNREFQYGE